MTKNTPVADPPQNEKKKYAHYFCFGLELIALNFHIFYTFIIYQISKAISAFLVKSTKPLAKLKK